MGLIEITPPCNPNQWRCRFYAKEPEEDLYLGALCHLLSRVEQNGLRWMHIEKLNEFEGQRAFSRAQGEN